MEQMLMDKKKYRLKNFSFETVEVVISISLLVFAIINTKVRWVPFHIVSQILFMYPLVSICLHIIEDKRNKVYYVIYIMYVLMLLLQYIM